MLFATHRCIWQIGHEKRNKGSVSDQVVMVAYCNLTAPHRVCPSPDRAKHFILEKVF